ncbi:MAG: hypothetical protein ACERKO_10610 [Acetanaerobacterium sp.]
MVKTYRFLSAYVLYIIVGNLLVGQVLSLLGSEGFVAAMFLNILTIYIGGLWVVFKLLQAHFTDKMLEVRYTLAVKKKINIWLIVSAAVCVVLLAMDVPGFFSAGYSPNETYNTLILFRFDVRIANLLSPLKSLPAAVIILLVNGYVRLFYKLAQRMEENKKDGE